MLISFIIFMAYMNTYKEPFNSNKQTFILLGDSILKNDAYVSNGESVDTLLKERTNGGTICLAEDNSKISDIYGQLDKISEQLNSNYTTIFLSAGGNDILTYYVDQENNPSDFSVLGPLFASYKNLIKSIQNKLPNANIVLLDIYYPNNSTYKKYHTIIQKWNTMIYDYSREINNCSVLKVSTILTKENDFSFGIEPSATSSKKLVEIIINNY